MPYYIVNKIGTGTFDDKIRPDVDPGVAYVCGYSNDNKVLVLTDVPLAAKAGRIQVTLAQLKNAAEQRGLNYDDIVNKWYVRGG